MTLFKELLLQILLVLFPVLLYQILLLKRNSSSNETIPQLNMITILCILSALLCMLFSVRIEAEYVFNLSTIPLIISMVYGGPVSGLLTLLSIYFFQLGIIGHEILITLLNTLFVVIFSFLFIKKYKNAHRLTKVSYFTAVVCITSIIKVLVVLYILMNNSIPADDYIFLFILFPLISILTMWLSINLIENILERKWMEKEIQHAERLNVIGHLAASVAHEIRNPMTVVRGFMQIFNKESFIPDEKKEYLQLMIQELDRAETIINDYLALAKPRIDKSEQINIEEQLYFVQDIISSFATLNNVSILVQLESNLYIRGNPEKFNQVIINLLKNAIEASPEGAEVGISACKVIDNIRIDIVDEGIGLTNEEIKKLGTPFYSKKEKGTGLGLMVCYGIVEAMDGRIEVQSEKGKGTRFSIILPSG